MIEVSSYSELQEKLIESPNAYLLIYKSGSKVSDCAYNSVLAANREKAVVFVADVNNVKDIHPVYEIKTAPILLSFENGVFKNTYKGCNEVNYYTSVFERNLYVGSAKGDEKPQKRVTVYSTPSCSWCTTLKNHLNVNGIKYTDVDVSKDQKAAEAMVKKSGQQGVPQTDINGQVIVGFDKNKINSLLGIGQ
ncbi:MAG: hypothetical protein JW729_04500 [Bacteroidales bacterium]|nr:hypothetical protein [Bacteroidales bacterium]